MDALTAVIGAALLVAFGLCIAELRTSIRYYYFWRGQNKG